MTHPLNALDLVLLGLIAAFAVRGYRRGLSRTLLGALGLVVGAALASGAAPRLLLHVAAQDRPLVRVAVVFAGGLLGERILWRAATALRARAAHRATLAVDGLGGAAWDIAVLVALTAAVVPFLWSVPGAALHRELAGSAIVHEAVRLQPDVRRVTTEMRRLS